MGNRSEKWLAAGLGCALTACVVVLVRTALDAAGRRDYDARKRAIEALTAEHALKAKSSASLSANSIRARVPEERAYYLDFDTTGALFARDEGLEVYDPWCYHRHKSDLRRHVAWPEHPAGAWEYVTNSLGLREDRELAAVKPKLRILVTGDSHTDGFCDNRDAWPHLVEAALAQGQPSGQVEAINAANGGFCLYHYFGVLQKYLYLEPDVFIVALYPGNDFLEIRNPRAWFAGEPVPPASERELDELHRAHSSAGAGAMTQAFQSVLALRHHREEMDGLIATTVGLLEEMRALCTAEGIRFLCVVIPSPIDVPGEPIAEILAGLARELGVDDDELHVHARMAQTVVSELEQRGSQVVDVGPLFAAGGGPYYWRKDSHMNLHGHQVVAHAVVQRLASAVQERW